MKKEQEERQNFSKFNFFLTAVAVVIVAAVGAVLLHMQNLNHSVVIQPESDVTYTAPAEEKEAEPAAPQRININTAPKEELMLIHGIGKAKAENIIAYREQTPFQTIEDIMKVSGIGEKIFESIADSICVE